MGSSRRLAAIMFTDMVGFTALSQRDESLSLKLLEEQRAALRPIFQRHGGREVKTLGDGFLVEFPNALESVRCAYEIQRTSHEANYSLPPERRTVLRVGIHLGDVVGTNGDIAGDAVNVASRIEPLAEPGGVCITRQVYDQIQNKFELSMTSLGSKPLKNVNAPLEVFKVVMPWTEGHGEGRSEIDRNRIAILPLVNFSPSPGDEYFADGLTDEIISMVSGIRGLSVISRTSAMRYKQSTKSVTEIGRELKAGKLLEGSVRKAGNRVRITVQLIDSETDAHLWAQSYDGSLDDVFETQSDIARKVAEALKLPTPRPAARVENPEVFTLCLRAQTLWNKRTQIANDQAILLFEDALKLEPESARALAGLARCYTTAVGYGWVEKPPGYAKARSFAERALELDRESPEAHLALADVICVNDWPGAEAEVKKALALNPSDADAHEAYGVILRGMGRLSDAFEEARKAYELDPLPYTRAGFFLVSAFFADRTDEALAISTKMIEADPMKSWAYLARAILSSIKGDQKQAYRDLESYRRLVSEIAYTAARSRVEAHLGHHDESARLIQEALSLVDKSGTPNARSEAYQISYAYALNGDCDGFFQYVQYLIDTKELEPGELRDPSYRSMAGDPRFAQTLQRVRASFGITN